MPTKRKTMYYEEKWMEGELYYRHTPKGEWIKFTESQYRLRVLELERQVKFVDLADVGKSCNHQYVPFGCGFDKVCKVCGIVAPVE